MEVHQEARPFVVAAHDHCLGMHLAAALAEGKANVLILLGPQDDVNVIAHSSLLQKWGEPLAQESCSLVGLRCTRLMQSAGCLPLYTQPIFWHWKGCLAVHLEG